MVTARGNSKWPTLPQEIRDTILEYVPGRFAGICKDWRRAIEPRNFRTIEVDSDVHSLSQLRATFDENLLRQSYVRNLWFKITLPEHSITSRSKPQTSEEWMAENRCFYQATHDFLEILSTWRYANKADWTTYQGINWEVSLSSPSDVGNACGIEGLMDNWREGGRYVFNSVDLNTIYDLPAANCITGLSILRRNMRRISWSFFHWMNLTEPGVDLADVLTICESFSKIHVFEHGDLCPSKNWRFSSFSNNLTGALFNRSFVLEELLVCNFIDAMDFFDCIKRQPMHTAPPVWQNLRVLTMTSQGISAGGKPEFINGLISDAGRAAKQMPALRVMELYGAWLKCAGIFRYQVVGSFAKIGWASTWEFKLGDESKQIWWDVTQLRENRLVLQSVVEKHVYRYHGPVHFMHVWSVTRSLALHPSSSAALGYHNLPDHRRRFFGDRDLSL
ncbi:hypothetical protein CORC01_01302 [Colletotrichum orchidophilum]|uniref:DUF6546 domain-containing protein n=1 Tax=Colletotrichum orchidophilum TaxID=1209926 RepID=A0A1G4BQG7_9PEZI|nr:uncharacterized protein CORC01_01302 [Colletotrichum orchidophilum]OHF03583.1 hypothetical protein CORC01_01302 [Colletotrichum orchidophilum]